MEPLKDANKLKSKLPVKRGIPTPLGSKLKPPLKRDASTLSKENLPNLREPAVKFSPQVVKKESKPSYMRPTAARSAARKSLAKARRSLGRGAPTRTVSRVAPAVTKPSSRAPTTSRMAGRTMTTTARSTTTARATASRTTTRPGMSKTTAAPARTGTKRPAAGPAKVEEEPEEEQAGLASRVSVSQKTGKLLVKGVDKFNKAERNKIIELVCAEKIQECNKNTSLINSINETLKVMSAEKQRTEEEKKEIHKNYETKGLEFEALEDKFDSAKRDNKKLKRDLENTEEELDQARKKTQKVQKERDDVIEDYAQSERKINMLDKKLENANKEIDGYLEEIAKLKDANAEQRQRLDDGEEERKQLHEMIQQLKGNIRVFSRVRPLLSSEIEKGSTQEHITFDGSDGKAINVTRDDAKKERAEFEFDKVFTPKSTQSEVFTEVQQLVRSALDGYNVCIFAYGQTGSGKTFSMEGPDDVTDETRGIIPRSFDYLIKTIEIAKEKGWEYELEASYLEIYCEELRDLCEDTGNKKLEVLSTSNAKHINVTHLSSHEVKSQSQIAHLIKKAKKRRATASTQCNERSSRSHSVFILNITGHNTRTDQKIESCLNLIDLAGSERVKESGATGQRFEEAKKINSSLSSLGDVIAALGSKSKHIPYRNSKLTLLLRNSLGGNAKTLMLMHLNPNKIYSNESLNTLRFAQKVNNTNIGTAQKVVK